MRRWSGCHSDLHGELVDIPADARRGRGPEIADEPVDRGPAGDVSCAVASAARSAV